MGYLSIDDIMAFKSPEPLEETFHVEALGGDVLIRGVTKKAGLEAINAETKRMKSMKIPVTHPKTSETYTPDEGDIIAAVWIEACVVEPKLSSLQWLQFAAEGVKVLGTIFDRVLVCSRLDSEKGGVPDGIDAANAEIKDQEQNAPLV